MLTYLLLKKKFKKRILWNIVNLYYNGSTSYYNILGYVFIYFLRRMISAVMVQYNCFISFHNRF